MGKTDHAINQPDSVNVIHTKWEDVNSQQCPSDRTRDNGHRLKYKSQGETEKETYFLGVTIQDWPS